MTKTLVNIFYSFVLAFNVIKSPLKNKIVLVSDSPTDDDDRGGVSVCSHYPDKKFFKNGPAILLNIILNSLVSEINNYKEKAGDIKSKSSMEIILKHLEVMIKNIEIEQEELFKLFKK